GFLAFELLVCRVLTDGGKLVDPVVAANAGIGLDHHMRGDLCACADLDAGTDNAPRTDLDVVRESGTGINDGSRINQFPSSFLRTCWWLRRPAHPRRKHGRRTCKRHGGW